MDVSLTVDANCVCTFCESPWFIPYGYAKTEAINQLEDVAKDYFVRRIILHDGTSSMNDSSSNLNSSRLSHQGRNSDLLKSIILCDECVVQFVKSEETILKTQKSYLSKMTGKKDFAEILADPWLDVKRVAFAKLKSQEEEIAEKLRIIESTKPVVLGDGNQGGNDTTNEAASSSTSTIRPIASLTQVQGSQVLFELPGTLANNVGFQIVNHQSVSPAGSVSQEPQQSAATSNESASESDSAQKNLEKHDAEKNEASNGSLATLLKSSSAVITNEKEKKVTREVNIDSDENDSDSSESAGKKDVLGKKKQIAQVDTPLSKAAKEDNAKSSAKISDAPAAKKFSTSTPEENPKNKAKSGTKRPLTSTPLEESAKKTGTPKRLKSTSDEVPTKAKSDAAEQKNGSTKKTKSQIDKLLAFSKPLTKPPSQPTPQKNGVRIGHRLVTDSESEDDSTDESDSSDDEAKKTPGKKK